MKILISGVAGFVGSTLALRLIRDGHDVVGIDSMTNYYARQIKEANLRPLADSPNFTFHEEDLRTAPLDARLVDVGVVFHQAGQPGIRKSWGQDFTDYLDWNVLATQRLLEACRKAKHVTRLVYASSSSVYGDAATYPTSESALPQPISPYGVSKLAGEHLATLYAKNYGISAVSLRYFTVYGPRQRPDMAFTRFVTAAQAAKKITIFGDGTQVRDFTFVEDVVHANIAAGFSPGIEPGAVYNVAGGSSVSVNEVLRAVEAIHGAPLDIEYVPRSLGDAQRTGGDTTRIRQDLGWVAATTLEDGLGNQYAWAKDNLSLLSGAIAEEG